ncbi:MAG: hypothetical protein KBH14_08485 [Vicinamibacteria bacterium]|nr:hypothetical protein [Vicinamibacteria bacterium]
MQNPTSPIPPPTEEGLPFHPETVLRSLWRRRALVVAFTAFGAFLGVAIALSMGERRFVSETVVMFHPSGGTPEDVASSVQTVLNLVKVPVNLEQVRLRLNDDTPIAALASSFEVVAIKNTDLVAIKATAPTAALAAARANALRDAFLENQARLAAFKGARQSELLAAQLEEVKVALSAADQKRIDIGVQTGVVDLEKQTGTYLQQQASMEIFYGQALADRTAVGEQHLTLEKTVAELQRKIDKEQKAAGAQEDLTSLNIRSGRLRSSIEEDRKDRAARAELAQKEAEFTRATQLAREGLLSQSLLDKARAEFEAQKARATDTDQIRQWKDELARLDSGVIPTKPSDSASTGILREVMSKRLNLGLEKTAVDERVKSLDAARTQIKTQVERLPELKRQLSDVGREVESLEQRRRTLEELLAKARASASATSADFTLVSEALAPPYAKSSNRMIVLAGILGFCGGLSLLLVVAVELLDTTLRSAPEATLRTGARLLASIPWLPTAMAALPSDESSPAFAFFRRVAYQLRRDSAGTPLRILVTSARRGEGVTFVASQLAAAFGRLDERVVYVDARLQSAPSVDLRSLALSRDPMNGGRLLPAHIETAIGAVLKKGVASTATTFAKVRVSRKPLPKRILRAMVRGRRWYRGARIQAVALLRGSRDFVWSILWPASPAPTPSLAFAMPGAEGLGSYLSYKTHSSRAVAHSTDLIGLTCLPAGLVPAPLPESIAWRRMRDLIAELSLRHPVVVVDASGLLDEPDPEALADQADVVIVVARAERTTAADVKRTLARLAMSKAQPGGLVLNGVDRSFVDLLTEAQP